MIGAFYQPKLVLADISALDTLPDRELRAGLAEVIKYGLIRDLEFFDWLEANIEKLLVRDKAALIYAVHRSCANKAEVVAADERETGERALLNLGHTFGHAIETGLGYGEWLHGEAIAAGTLIAAELSRRLGWIDVQAVSRIEEAFRAKWFADSWPRSRCRALFGVDAPRQESARREVAVGFVERDWPCSDF